MTGLESILTNPLVQRVGWSLLHFLWQGAAVAVLLAGTLWLLRRRSSNVRYVVACSALLLMLAMPAATMWLARPVGRLGRSPDGTEAHLPPSRTEKVGLALLDPAYPDEIGRLGRSEAESHLHHSGTEKVGLAPRSGLRPLGPAYTAEPAPPWREQAGEAVRPALPWIVCGWLIGVLGLSAWHLRGWIQVQRLRRLGIRPVGREITEVLAPLCNRLGIGRAVQAVESALVRVPTVVGWLRPVILLPASALTGLTGEQLEAILAHELAHVRRHDYLVNLLQTAAETLLFYHPAVWWVSRRIRAERENCCDDLAVAASGRPLVYARALTAVAKLSLPQPRLAVAADGGGGNQKFLARIRRIVGLPTNDAGCRGRWLAGAFTLLGVLVITIALTISCAADKTPDVKTAAQPAEEMVLAGLTRTESEKDMNARLRFYTELLSYRFRLHDKQGYDSALSTAGKLARQMPEVAPSPNNLNRTKATMAIAIAQVTAGDIDGGKWTAHPVLATAQQQGLCALAHALVKAGDRQGALGVAQTQSNPDRQWGVVATIATTEIELGQLSAAQDTAAIIPFSYHKPPVMIKLLAAYAKQGDTTEFRKVLTQVRKLIYNDRLGVSVEDVCDVAAQLARVGDSQGFQHYQGFAMNLAERRPKPGPDAAYAKRRAWMAAAVALAEKGDLDGADKAIAHVPADWRDHARRDVISALARQGQPDKAAARLKALDGSAGASLLCELAVAYARKGDWNQYRARIRQAMPPVAGPMVYDSKVGSFASWTLSTIAAYQLQAGDWQGARDTSAHNLALQPNPFNPADTGYWKWCNKWIGIARQWAASGQTGGLKEWTERIPDEQTRPFAFLAAAEGLAGLVNSDTPTTLPATHTGTAQPTAGRDVSIIKRIELIDKDGQKSCLYCVVSVHDNIDRLVVGPVYEEIKTAHLWHAVHEYRISVLMARLAGVYPTRGTLKVAQQVLQDKTITIRLRYINDEKDIWSSPMVRVASRNKKPKSVYLWGKLPENLPQGKYTVKVELDEYIRKGNRLVPAPKDRIRHSERLTCTFTVPAPAKNPTTRPAAAFAEVFEELLADQAGSSWKTFEAFLAKTQGQPAVRRALADAFVKRALDGPAVGLQSAPRHYLHDTYYINMLKAMGARKHLRELLGPNRRYRSAFELGCCIGPMLVDALAAHGQVEDAWLLVKHIQGRHLDGQAATVHKALCKLTKAKLEMPLITSPEQVKAQHRAMVVMWSAYLTDRRYRQMKLAMPEIVRRVQGLETGFSILKGISAFKLRTSRTGGATDTITVHTTLAFSRNVKFPQKATGPMPIKTSKPYCALQVSFWESHQGGETLKPNKRHHKDGTFGLSTWIFTGDSKLKDAFDRIVKEEMAKADSTAARTAATQPASAPAAAGDSASPVKPAEFRLSGTKVFEASERTHNILKNVFVVVKFSDPDDAIAVETAFTAGQQIVWCPVRSSRPPEYRFRGHWKVNENGELNISGRYEPANGAIELPPRLRNLKDLRYVVTGVLLRQGAPPYSHTLDLLIKRAPPQADAATAPATKPAGKTDRPRPDIWRKYPHLKEKLDADMGRMKTYLISLEPEAFAAKHSELVKMAKSEDPLQRARAVKAISALRDKPGLPFVVAAVEKEKTPRRGPRGNLIRGTQCLNCLTKWVYDAYHPDRKTPRELAPLLPLFVKMLVETGDEPNVRGCCFQAIGCLAGPEWLPLVKDLSASRHPAVTHWSGWALKEIAKRAKPATKPVGKTITRIYDVRDLIVPTTDFQGPEVGWVTKQDKGKKPAPVPSPEAEAKMLMNTIKETVAPASWRPKGKTGGMRFADGNLTITQTAENHQAIKKLLEGLHGQRNIRISVEARFIQIPPGTDGPLTEWLTKKTKATFRQGRWGSFLSEKDAKDFAKEAQRLGVTKLTSPRMTLRNEQWGCVRVVSEKMIKLPFLPPDDKGVLYRDGVVFVIKAAVSADRRGVMLKCTAKVAELSQEFGQIETCRARSAAAVSVPDGKTILFRVPYLKHRPIDIQRLRDPATGKVISSRIVEDPIPSRPQRWLYILIKPKTVAPRKS